MNCGRTSHQNLRGVNVWNKQVTDVSQEKYEIECEGGSFSAQITFSTEAKCQQNFALHKESRTIVSPSLLTVSA